MKSLFGRFSRVCWILLALVAPAMAQDANAVAAHGATGWAWVGAGLAIGIGTFGPGLGLAGGLPEEGGLLAIAFIKMGRQTSSNRNNKPWYASAGAKFGNGLGSPGQEWHQLERIQNMAFPDRRGCGGSNQIDALLPCEQKIDVGLEPFACFT